MFEWVTYHDVTIQEMEDAAYTFEQVDDEWYAATNTNAAAGSIAKCYVVFNVTETCDIILQFECSGGAYYSTVSLSALNSTTNQYRFSPYYGTFTATYANVTPGQYRITLSYNPDHATNNSYVKFKAPNAIPALRTAVTIICTFF